MFKNSKPLIGTPNDGKSKNIKTFEFTPIGYSKDQNDENRDPKTNTMKRTDSKTAARLGHLSTLKRNPFEESPLANSVRGGSSFIEPDSFDTIHYSDDNRHKQQHSKQKTSSPVPSGFDNKNFLSNGSNPVRLQQENASKLYDENYNLKLKIAGLTKFLHSVTNNEQQEIYQQNSELQEKLIEMRGEISLLNQQLSEYQRNDSSQAAPRSDHRQTDEEIDRYREEIRSLNEIIRELRESDEERKDLERETDKLHQIIEDLESQLENKKQSSISPAYVDKLEEQLDDLKSRLHDNEFEMNRKDEEIEEKEDRLEEMEELLKRHKQLSDKQQDQTEDELEEMKDLVQKQKNQIESLMEDLDEKDSIIDQMKSDYNSLNDKLKQDYAKLKNDQMDNHILKRELQELQDFKTNKTEQLNQLQSKHDDLLTNVNQLRLQLKDSQNVIRDQEKLIKELRSNESSSNEKIYKFADDLKSKVKSLEKELHGILLERDVLQKQLAKSDQEIIALKNNNERTYNAYNELKKKISLQQRSTPQGNDHTQKEKYWKSELEILSNQLDNLNVENKKLAKELQNERVIKNLDTDTYDKHEVKSLTAKCNDLQMQLSERENSLNNLSSRYKKEIEQLKTTIREKEEELRQVSNELRAMKFSTAQQIDNEKLEALKLKSSKEYQIKALQIELNSLKEEHETELKSYKNLIERLKKASSEKDIDGYRSKLSNSATNETNELLQKINDKNMKIKILNNKLTEAVSNLNILEHEVTRLENSKISLMDDNKKLVDKIDTLTSELVSQRREIDQLLARASDYSSYELKRELKLKDKQLQESNMEFNDMKSELINKYRSVHEEKATLEKKMDRIIQSYRQLKSNINSKVNNSSKAFVMIQDQADFYRMKYNKCTYVINDLKFINSFVMKSIQATNNHVKKDVKKLQNAGIYPDYDLICNKKPSAKVLFKFVVAAVRMKRKTEHSSIRNKKLENLKFRMELKDY